VAAEPAGEVAFKRQQILLLTGDELMTLMPDLGFNSGPVEPHL
jgi:hypothetical protein